MCVALSSSRLFRSRLEVATKLYWMCFSVIQPYYDTEAIIYARGPVTGAMATLYGHTSICAQYDCTDKGRAAWCGRAALQGDVLEGKRRPTVLTGIEHSSTRPCCLSCRREVASFSVGCRSSTIAVRSTTARFSADSLR